MARKFSIYKLTSPSGRAYVGFTGQEVAERWRQHVNRAGTKTIHPLYAAIRKYGREGFKVETLATYGALDEALRAEVAAIAGLENGYNVSPGGEGDGGAGAARFRELLADPEWRAAYVARLSFSMKNSERFAESRKKLEGLLDAWRDQNPAKAYHISMRNLRIGANRHNQRRPASPVPARLPRKPKGPAAVFHKKRASREAAKRHWAEMDPGVKSEVHARIAQSVTKAHAAKSPEEKAAHAAQLAEARKSIDHDVRKARQAEALARYWTPERRAEIGAKRRAAYAALPDEEKARRISGLKASRHEKDA